MLFDLTNKVVLVTGGSRGIGLGMARALVEHGARVMIWGTNPANLESAQQDLGAEPVSTACVDVGDAEAVEAGMADLVARLGRLDCAIANAGIGPVPTGFCDQTKEDWDRVLQTNLFGTVFTLQSAARHMIARAGEGDAGGSLVGLVSQAAIDAAPKQQSYGASKAAVASVIKSAAVELARYGIRANAIHPGWIATDMTQASQDSDAFDARIMPRIPMRRWGRPEDFAGVAVYLASDASRYHTGDTLVVDGGYAAF